ncbi:hypothetical protein SERLA73DRAFT_191180, partial [Serpula lacrymans var. lacrymans S7.3]
MMTALNEAYNQSSMNGTQSRHIRGLSREAQQSTLTIISWRWGGGNPSGQVAEIVEEGKAQVTSNKVRAPQQARTVNHDIIVVGKHSDKERQAR